MATELTRLSAFLQRIRQSYPQAVVIKFTDLRRPGIPDCFIAYKGQAVWVEAKHAARGTDVATLLEPMQKVVLLELCRAEQNTFVLVFEKGGGITLYDPQELGEPVFMGLSVDEAIRYLLFPEDVFFAEAGNA